MSEFENSKVKSDVTSAKFLCRVIADGKLKVEIFSVFTAVPSAVQVKVVSLSIPRQNGILYGLLSFWPAKKNDLSIMQNLL